MVSRLTHSVRLIARVGQVGYVPTVRGQEAGWRGVLRNEADASLCLRLRRGAALSGRSFQRRRVWDRTYVPSFR